MTENHHDPHEDNYPLTKVEWNRPLGQLDAALTGMVTRTPFTKLLIGSGTLPSNQIAGGTTTTQGFRLSRMTTTERDAIVDPATGLMVYNVTTGTINFYDGSDWLAVSTSETVGALQRIDEGDDSNVASISISGIPATFLDLILILSMRSRKAASNRDDIYMRFNGDSGNDYQVRGSRVQNGSFSSTDPNPGVDQAQIELYDIPAANADSEWRSYWWITIPNYSRTALGASGWYYETARIVPENIFRTSFGRFQWQNATSSIINQITLAPAAANNFDCTYYLYGRGEL